MARSGDINDRALRSMLNRYTKERHAEIRERAITQTEQAIKIALLTDEEIAELLDLQD